jgi:hypothetical protein
MGYTERTPMTAGEEALIQIANALEKIVTHLDNEAAEKQRMRDEKTGR